MQEANAIYKHQSFRPYLLFRGIGIEVSSHLLVLAIYKSCSGCQGFIPETWLRDAKLSGDLNLMGWSRYPVSFEYLDKDRVP